MGGLFLVVLTFYDVIIDPVLRLIFGLTFLKGFFYKSQGF